MIFAGSRSAGMNRQALMPALAAWAATEPARLQVEEHDRTPKPNSSALLLAMLIGRSLKEKVGLTVSFLSHRLFRPSALPRLWALTSGVKPACVSTIRSPSIGSSAR